MIRRCAHCGAEYVVHHVADRYCPPCEQRVRELTAQDAARRQLRFTPKDMSGWNR